MLVKFRWVVIAAIAGAVAFAVFQGPLMEAIRRLFGAG